MAYRQKPGDPWVNANTVCDVGTFVEFHILNGAVAEFTFPCTYIVYEDDGTTTEEDIHLTAEGYTDPTLVVDDAPDGLTWYAEIDPSDDHIVRLLLDADCPDAVAVPVTCNMTLFINRTDTSTPGFPQRTDAVVRGRLLIAPSPYIAAGCSSPRPCT